MTLKTLETLRKRADFLRLNRGRRSAVHGLMLQAALTPDAASPQDDNVPMRLGLTVTKKIGNAVVRNKVRRRLRAAARAVLPVAGCAGYDYVLIARQGTLGRSFTDLKSDLERALKAVHSPKPGGKAGPKT